MKEGSSSAEARNRGFRPEGSPIAARTGNDNREAAIAAMNLVRMTHPPSKEIYRETE